jgi:streptogramin lyase
LLAIQITQFPVTATSPSSPQVITEGQDGDLWFTEASGRINGIGVFDPSMDTSVDIPSPTPNSNPASIISAPDGMLWFTEPGTAGAQIGSVNPATHKITEYPLSTASGVVVGIAADSDGNLWMTEPGTSKIAEYDPTTQVLTEYPTHTANSQPQSIILGPGGDLWFTELAADKIGEIDPTTHAITEFSVAGSQPVGITVGPDGNLWYTAPGSSAIGWFDPTSQATGSVATPTSGSDPIGIADGPGGDLSFTESAAGKIGVIDPSTKAISENGNNLQPINFPGGMTTGPGGDPWFVTDGDGSTVGEVRDLPATTTTLVASPNPAYIGNPVTLTATVKPSSGTGTPTGSVFFFDGTTQLGSVPLTGADQASLTISSLALGTHSLTAEYEGDTKFAQGTSAPVSEVIQIIPSTTTISAVPNTSTYGHNTVTLIVTVSGPPGVTPPSGLADFQIFVNGTRVYIGLNNSAGFSFVDNFLPGQYLVSAIFSGTPMYAPSASGVSAVTVYPDPTTTQLIVAPNPQATGRPVTLAANVTALYAAPVSGTVTFLDGTTPLGTEDVDGDNPAFLTVPSLPAGLNILTAEFSGTSGFAPSVSASVAEQIIPVLPTTTTLYPSPNPVPYGQVLTLTATVAPAAGGGTPTGVVSFSAHYMFTEYLIGTAPVGANGQAVLVIPSTTVATQLGLYPITAVYQGDTAFAQSASNSVYESIAAPDGPQVLAVARVAGSRGTTPLLVAFNEALHPESAQDTRNYFLTAPGHRKIAIKAAVYDAALDAVVLTPAAQLAPRQTYLLTVIGTGPLGVTDAEGRRLDGEFIGQPGSNYVNAIRPASPAPKPGAARLTKASVAAELAAHRQAMAAARRHH